MNIAIFASGTGSNADVIIRNLGKYISLSEGCVKLILTNNKSAGVLSIAFDNRISTEIIDIKQKTDTEAFQVYKTVLLKHKIDFIVLAGYLKKIPADLTKVFPEKIVNIHPALLPMYGGAGMYGAKVHEAVVAAKEKESGITVHFVDKIYDNGKIIFQAKCTLEDNETALSLAKKVQCIEYENYTRVIAEVISKINKG